MVPRKMEARPQNWESGHSLISQMFTEHLLCARLWMRRWEGSQTLPRWNSLLLLPERWQESQALVRGS